MLIVVFDWVCFFVRSCGVLYLCVPPAFPPIFYVSHSHKFWMSHLPSFSPYWASFLHPKGMDGFFSFASTQRQPEAQPRFFLRLINWPLCSVIFKLYYSCLNAATGSSSILDTSRGLRSNWWWSSTRRQVPPSRRNPRAVPVKFPCATSVLSFRWKKRQIRCDEFRKHAVGVEIGLVVIAFTVSTRAPESSNAILGFVTWGWSFSVSKLCKGCFQIKNEKEVSGVVFRVRWLKALPGCRELVKGWDSGWRREMQSWLWATRRFVSDRPSCLT